MSEHNGVPPVPATWTDDCQGKKDYDGELVCLSTRYWPAGHMRADVKPSATATIYLGSAANDYYDDAVELATIDVTAETEAEVKAQVEAWAAEQFGRIARVLRHEFGVPESQDE